MNKILISLTVIHTRLPKLHLTLRSLLGQDYKNFEVRIYASREPFLLDHGIPDVPAAIQRLISLDSRLSWRWVPNIGSYRKLLPALNEMIDEDQLIVTADDDTIYPPTWLSTLVQYYSLLNCIVTFRGHFIAIRDGAIAPYRSWMRQGIAENPSELVFPTGKDGVLYHTSHFDRRVLDYLRALELAPTSDDVWFKWHTAVNNVPVYCIEPDSKISLVETSEGPSLYFSFNHLGANDQAIMRLHDYAVTEWNFDLTNLSTRRLATAKAFAPVSVARSTQRFFEDAHAPTDDIGDAGASNSGRPKRPTSERIVREVKRFFRRLKLATEEKTRPVLKIDS